MAQSLASIVDIFISLPPERWCRTRDEYIHMIFVVTVIRMNLCWLHGGGSVGPFLERGNSVHTHKDEIGDGKICLFLTLHIGFELVT